jgi:enhancing lycopene biosynthesis protein 2
MALGQWSASTSDSGGAYISLNKSNSSPVGTHAAILPNQRVGAIGFAGSDGSMFVGLADIYGESDGVVAANNIPGRLIFATNTGRLNPVEQMRLDSAGRLGINTTAPTSLLHVDGTALITGITTVSNVSVSNSTTTGALVVTGGVGIGGNLHVGGEIVAQKLTIQLTTITTTMVQTDDIIKTLNTTAATNTTTGALQVTGGAGIGGNIYVGGQIAVATITSISGDITIDPNGNSNVVFGTGAQVKILDTTLSSSTATGALVVSGGMGVAEDIYVGGQIAVSTITSILGDITIDPNGNSNVVFGTGAQVKILDTTAASSTITGALVVSGGMGVAEDIYVGGQVNVTSTTDSASITTGALVVSGGAGFSKNLYVGGQIAVSTITSISGNITIDPNGVSDVVFGTGAQVKINDVTGSTTTATGALVVSGGLGVAQNLYVGGEVKFGSPQGSALRHVTNGYTNGSQIFVSTSTPTASAVGDIWIKI